MSKKRLLFWKAFFEVWVPSRHVDVEDHKPLATLLHVLVVRDRDRERPFLGIVDIPKHTRVLILSASDLWTYCTGPVSGGSSLSTSAAGREITVRVRLSPPDLIRSTT